MRAAIEEYLTYLRAERDASAHTLRNYRVDLEQFLAYLQERGASGGSPSPEAVDHLAIRGFLARLHGAHLAKSSVAPEARDAALVLPLPLPAGPAERESGEAGAGSSPPGADDAAP